MSCSILILNCPCSVTKAKCKPNIICHSCKTFWALQLYNVAINATYYVIFHLNFNHPLRYFNTKMQGCKIY